MVTIVHSSLSFSNWISLLAARSKATPPGVIQSPPVRLILPLASEVREGHNEIQTRCSGAPGWKELGCAKAERE
jgi:hypothetical protein